jgi:hypothetical membrane protein
MSSVSAVESAGPRTTALLVCGTLAPFVYIGTDIVASALYPGYSFAAQAPSELFAIGAPTSRLVVTLFSLSSLLLLAFAVGVWRTAGGSRLLQVLAMLIAANGLDSLALWQFPMHMRGVTPAFTDRVHLILAVNPFVLLSIALGVVAFRNWFRFCSMFTVVVLIALATVAFSYVPDVAAHRPTPWLGLSERSAQYAHQVWHAVLAVVLMQSRFPAKRIGEWGSRRRLS